MNKLLVVILLALVVLTSGCIGTAPPSSSPADTYIPQQISVMKTVSGEARVSAYPVDFIENKEVIIGDIEVAAGVGAGSVLLCMHESEYCAPDYLFGDGFDMGIGKITALSNQTGRIRVFANEGRYHLGFNAEAPAE